MDFIAIDFEVANMWNRASACSIGIAEYKDGSLINEFYSLINPNDHFDSYCIEIHGITPEMVLDQPNFQELWNDIQHFFSDRTVIAHNASFDMSILRHCLNRYNITFPNCDYACTYLLAKRIYSGLPSYRLDYITDHLKLTTFNHHQALDDAKASANILLNFIDIKQEYDLKNLAKTHEYRLGKIISDSNTYRPFSSTRKSKKSTLNANDIKASTTNFDINHPFYEKEFAFTGTLNSMTRRNAMQKVVDIGGLCGNGVTMKTNFLVVGVQDYAKLKDGKKSSKMKKAEELANKGIEIEIITEDDFLKSL